jgi:hypothetical protein
MLPYIIENTIPENFRANLKKTIETLADEIHRSAPASVIDRTRDVASHALLAYFDLQGSNTKDLSDLSKKLEENKKYLSANTARVIALLHSRAKPVEIEKRTLPQIREQDADLAVQCVSTLLCEIGFAKWL